VTRYVGVANLWPSSVASPWGLLAPEGEEGEEVWEWELEGWEGAWLGHPLPLPARQGLEN